MKEYSAWFWKNSFWLPEGVTFNDLKNKSGILYPKPGDMLFVPLFGFLVLGIRHLFEKFVALPISNYYKLDNGKRTKRPAANSYLETFYVEKSMRPTKLDIAILSKHIGMQQAFIQNWFRQRRNIDKPNMQTKFIETSWKFSYYTAVFCYGITYLWQKPWFWNHSKCWTNFPHQNLDTTVYIHFVVESGYYTSLLISTKNDIVRKDFWAQFIHHITALMLIIFSYSINFVRIGSLTMVLHDAADVLLQGAKCFLYLQYPKMADLTFVAFATTFLFSRLFLFPCWIIYNATVTSVAMMGPYTANYLFTALLCVLQCLHVYWSFLIIKMAVEMMFRKPGKKTKDHRSDDEEESENEDNERKVT